MQNTINADVLRAATDLMFGPQGTEVIAKVYHSIKAAAEQAYELGKLDGQANAEAAINAAFDEGWQYGEAEGKDTAADLAEVAVNASYDEGYLNGVSDARARPTYADDNVQAIIGEAASAAFGEVEVLDEDFDPSEYTIVDEDYCSVCGGPCAMLVDDED